MIRGNLIDTLSEMPKGRKKQLDIDIWVITIVTMLIFTILIGVQSSLYSFIDDGSVNILLRTFIIAFFQFGVAGLGIVIVMIYRKESFKFHGLVLNNLSVTVFGSLLLFVPYLIYIFVTNQYTGYSPLSVLITPEVLNQSFPVNIIGIFLIAVAWGFFEGFNYVVISNKVNERYPCRLKFLNWGAVVCTIMCILIHGLIGVTVDALFELFAVIFVVYGMILLKDHFKNSWGIIVIFIFLWNAF